MSKKVLFIFPRLGIGGITKSLSFVANCCSERGYETICLSLSDEEQTIPLNKDISIQYLCYTNGKNLLYKFFYLLKLKKKIRKISPRLIVAFGADYVRMVTFATSKMNIAIIGSERGNPYLYAKKQKDKYVDAFLKCDRVVFQTEGAQKVYGTNIMAKSTIIPNVANQRFHNSSLKREHVTNSIVVCSRLSKEKNVKGIIEAFSLSTMLVSNYVLKIYGDGPEKAVLEEYVAQKCLKKSVVFLGNVANVFEIEHCAALYVLNSDYEGMPNSLIEAMSLGIPSVATDCPPGGVSFLSDNNRRVKLVPVNDTIELSKAMTLVCTDKKVSKNLSDHSKEILEVLSPKRISAMWLDLITNVIGDIND